MSFPWEEVVLPSVVVLASMALGTGIGLVTSRRSSATLIEARGRRTDLAEERDSVLEALRELEQHRDKIEPADYQRERHALLTRGAAAMRELDNAAAAPTSAATGPIQEIGVDKEHPDDVGSVPSELIAALTSDRHRLGNDRYLAVLALLEGARPVDPGTREAAPPPAAPPAEPRGWLSPRWEGALWMFGVAVIIGGILLFLVMQDRGGGGVVQPKAPEGVMQSGPRAQVPDVVIAARAQLQEDPKNLDALDTMTEWELQRRNTEAARSYNERAKAIAPNDPDVRIKSSLIAYNTGDVAEAVRILDALLVESPDEPQALMFRGLFTLNALKDPKGALPFLERALELATGEDRGFLKKWIADAKGETEAAATATSVITARVELGPGVTPPPGAFLYASVKLPDGRPMPIYAKKLRPDSFPVELQITNVDTPMGDAAEPPEKVRLEVRLDLDGNVMTKEDLPSAVIDDLVLPASGLVIVLK